MKKLIKWVVVGVVTILIGVIFLVLRRNEDAWLCQDGKWVKHGNPSSPKPTESCPSETKPVNFGPQRPSSNYRNRNFSEFPPVILSQKNATVVDVANNNITSLPAEIGKLTKVREFNVSFNKLTGSLPAEIRMMQDLRILRANNNLLTGIPAEIGSLKKLEWLDLSNNNINTIPKELYNLRDNLKGLNIAGNLFSADQLTEIKNGLPKTKVVVTK